MNNYKNKFNKYNNKIQKLYGGMINISSGFNLLNDKNENLQPYNKVLTDQDELDELIYFQMFVLPNVTINGIKLGLGAGNNFVAIAGGYDSIVYGTKYNQNKLIIKVQKNSWRNDIKNYKILGKNISSSLIKMYGAFTDFNNIDSIDTTVISYTKTDNVAFNKSLQNVYMIFESADDNTRNIIGYLGELKKSNPQKWIELLDIFIIHTVKGLKYLHDLGYIHLDIKPENIVYFKDQNDYYNFKIIDMGTMKQYIFESSDVQSYAGSKKYCFINKNTPFRDYNNLWLTVCQVFMLINDHFDYSAKDEIRTTELIKNLCDRTKNLSSNELLQKIDLKSVLDSDITKRIESNLLNLWSALKEFNTKEQGKSNISKNVLQTYMANFVLEDKKIHNGQLESPYYEAVRDGVKIYEVRVYDDKRKIMNIGDSWVFTHSTDKTLPPFTTTIVGIKIYKSFEDAVNETGPIQLLPQIDNVEEAIKIYEGFNNGKYKTDAITYGVVRFTLKKN